MMALLMLYIFTMPYQKLYINLLESFVLADLAVLLMVALTDQFKVGCIIEVCKLDSIFNFYFIVQDQILRNLNVELIDECGRVNTISEHVTMMIPLYHTPLLVSLIVLVVKLLVKIKATYKTRYILCAKYMEVLAPSLTDEYVHTYMYLCILNN